MPFTPHAWIDGESVTFGKLNDIETGIDTADATADAAVPKSLYDAHTIVYATTDNTPVALTVAASTIVGRKATGNIGALSVAEVLTLLGVGIEDTLSDHGNAGTSETVDLVTGVHRIMLDQPTCAITLTYSGPGGLTAGEAVTSAIRLQQDATGGRAVTFTNGTVIAGSLANISTLADDVTELVIQATWNGSGIDYDILAPPASSTGSSLAVQNQNGTPMTAVSQLDFRGAGVVATAGTGEVIINIPGNEMSRVRTYPGAMDIWGGTTKVQLGPTNQKSQTVLSFPNTGVDNTDKATGAIQVPSNWNTAEFWMLVAGDAAGVAPVYYTVDFPTAYITVGSNLNTASATRGGDTAYPTPTTAYVLSEIRLTTTSFDVSTAAGKTLPFQIMRRSSEATDTYAGNALVFAVELRWIS